MNDIKKHFWEITYRQHIGKMIGICRRYTQNRQIAEDLAHDAFLVAIDKISSFANKGLFEAWLRRIAVNVALQYLRKQKKQKTFEVCVDTDPLIEIQDENPDSKNNTFTEAELLKAISLLPEHHRLVFNLYVIDHFTHAQIGKKLGISEGTSKSHLARARKKIRELLSDKFKENKKRTLLLFMLPYRFWNIDYFFKKQLTSFEIPPQKLLSSEAVDFSDVAVPTYKPTATFPETYWKTSIASVAITVILVTVSTLYINSYKEKKSLMVAEHRSPANSLSESDSKNNQTNKFLISDSASATFSNNAIITSEKTKHSEKMKNVNTLGALLITGSVLAFDTTGLSKKPPVTSDKQELVANNKIELPKNTQAGKPATVTDSAQLSGTFYSSKLFWSATNNGIYLIGKHVKVNLKSNKFSGSGTFTFINKVDYLVIDGTPMKLNETIKLSEKQYNLIELSENESLKKYGDKRKVVEISLAE